MPADACGVGPDSQIPAAWWEEMVRLLPPPTPTPKDSRPRMDDRHAMTAISSHGALRRSAPGSVSMRRLGQKC